jgi:hypothetical protein
MTRGLVVLVVVLIGAGTAIAATPGHAADSTLSPGCTTLNDPSFDGQYNLAGTDFPETFNAGERIEVTAGNPTSLGTPTRLSLRINGSTVATAPFPGTVAYTIASTGVYRLVFDVNTGNATFSVSCGRATPQQLLADLESTVNGLDLHHGTAASLTSKLQEALDAVAADRMAKACGSLNAFVNFVNAQAGKKITDDQAVALVAAVGPIRDGLGC